MPAGFFEADIVGATYIETWFGKFVDTLPSMVVTAPQIMAPLVMRQVIAAVKANTPVDTGELRDDTGWRTTQDVPEMHVEVFSSAANVKTGYNYARARAFGFNKVNGDFWEPPEQPPYPEAALQMSVGLLDSIGTFALLGEIMRSFKIAH